MEVTVLEGPYVGFGAWYAAEHPSVLAMCTVLSGSEEVARDAVDEAFVRALARWDSVAQMDRRTGWIHLVAMNCLRRGQRRQAFEKLIHLRQRPTICINDEVPNVDLWAAVRDLPKRQREAVVLRYVADLAESDIAELMGVTRGTVASTIAEARSHLANILSEDRTSGGVS